MKILSIDTASDNCCVSILDDQKVIVSLSNNSSNTHSVCLMPMINQAFEDSNLSIDDIDLFVCDKGPGSFTGIRIGISTIKAFGDVTNKPCIGISSLKALAYTIIPSDKFDYVCSLIDAKHENCYCGIFKKTKNGYAKVTDYFFDSITNIIDILKKINKKIIFCRKC